MSLLSLFLVSSLILLWLESAVCDFSPYKFMFYGAAVTG